MNGTQMTSTEKFLGLGTIIRVLTPSADLKKATETIGVEYENGRDYAIIGYDHWFDNIMGTVPRIDLAEPGSLDAPVSEDTTLYDLGYSRTGSPGYIILTDLRNVSVEVTGTSIVMPTLALEKFTMLGIKRNYLPPTREKCRAGFSPRIVELIKTSYNEIIPRLRGHKGDGVIMEPFGSPARIRAPRAQAVPIEKFSLGVRNGPAG